jgi:HD superfamily phosphohydrolase YqeK
MAANASKKSYGKVNLSRVMHDDGSYMLSLSYLSKTDKRVELVENHTTGKEETFDAWTCVYYSETLKKCRGWHVEKWDTYNKISNKWVKQ